MADWRRAMKAADMASIHHVAYALNAAARGIIHEWLNSRMESLDHHTAAQLFIAQGFYLAELPCEPRRVRGYVRGVLSGLRAGRIPAIPSPEPSRKSA